MKRRFIIILICISTFFAFNTSKSAFGQYFDNTQTSGFFGNFSINANVGAALPFADVSQDFKPYQDDWKMAYGAIFRKQFSPIFGIGGQFLMGNLHGTVLTWGDGSTANQYFDSEFMEMNVHAVINLSNLIFGYNENRTVHLYSTIGLGFANWASIRRDLNTDAEIPPRSGFDANNIKAWTPTLSIPAGLGLYFAVGKKFGFNIEASMHRLNSDDLDAYVSGKANQDSYSYISAGLTYNLSAVGNVFRKAGKQETNYDREARKLEKYQERLAKKNRRDELREEMEQERKTNVEKTKRSHRDPSAGMPKVIEYDAAYNHVSIQKTDSQITDKFAEPKEEGFKGDKELVFDEGKHIITGGGEQVKTTDISKSANIISARDALRLKTDAYENTINNVTGRTTSIISGGVLAIPETGKIYTVQIMASRLPAKNISEYRENYGIHQPIYYSLQNGLYRYSTGLFTNYYDAQTYANVIKRNGLGDVFVATYNNGLRVLN